MASFTTEAIQAFQEYKLRGNGSYLIFQLTGNGKIEVTNKGTNPIEWEDFVALLPIDQACWAIKSFHYETKEGGQRSKCLLVQWIPEKSNKRDKMSYAMWCNDVKKALQGIHTTLQANSVEDLSREGVLQTVARYERDLM